MESALYFGRLHHRRVAPRAHEFNYPVFMAYLDVDRIPELMRVSRLASYNRWNWAAFCDRDHFGDARLAMRERLRLDAAGHGITLPDGKIFLLTNLRYLGYGFNPVSFYYCFDGNGRLEMMMAEVNNTYGASRNYWLTSACQLPAENSLRYRTAKKFHVSPFNVLDLDYTWAFTAPGERLVAHMCVMESGRGFFDATLDLDERQAWSASALRRALLRHPAITAKVITAIHWQALRLRLKGLRYIPNPGRTRAEQTLVEARRVAVTASEVCSEEK